MTGFFLLAIAWLVPLHFMPWVSWHGELVAFVAAFVLVFCVALDRRSPKPAFEIPRSAILFFCVALVIVVQALSRSIEFRGDAIVLELYVALCVAGLTCGYVQGKRENAEGRLHSGTATTHPLQPLAFTLLAGAFASTVIALAQVFDVWPTQGWIVRMPNLRRPGGNLAQPNHLGTLTLMGLVSLLYLWELGRIRTLACSSLFVVLALGFAVTESRTALVGLLLLLTITLVARKRGLLSVSPAVLIGAVASMVTLFVCWPMLMATSGSFSAGAAVNAQPGWRLIVWPQLLQAIAMRPWQGWGLHEVAKAHNAVASRYTAAEPYTYAHNLVLEMAIGWGIPLTVLAIGVVTYWIRHRIPFITTDAHWFCIAAALPFCVHSMLEFPYAYAYFLLPVTYLVGVFEAQTIGKPLPPTATRLAGLAFVAVLVLAITTVYDYVRIEEDFRVARFEALHIGQRPPDHSRPAVLLLSQLDALLDAARLEPHAGMSASELELARGAAMRFPTPATQNRYALSLALNGSRDEAIRQLQVIRTLHGDEAYRQIQSNWHGLARRHPEWASLLDQ